jgi:hypothetical protein
MDLEIKEQCYFDKNNGYFTGLTVYNNGTCLGYSYCHPGRIFKRKYITDQGQDALNIVEVSKPDEFNKKVGREIARGRAELTRELLEEGHPMSSIMDIIYSKRLQTRIREYSDREIIRQQLKELNKENAQ